MIAAGDCICMRSTRAYTHNTTSRYTYNSARYQCMCSKACKLGPFTVNIFSHITRTSIDVGWTESALRKRGQTEDTREVREGLVRANLIYT